MSQTSPQIVIYLKTFCGWCEGVRATMRKYHLSYEAKDVVKNPAFRWEMEQRSGQPLCPCVEVDGHMLADVSGEEVEKWLIQNEYVRKDEPASAPGAAPPPAPGAAPSSRPIRSGTPPKTVEPAKARTPGKTGKSRFFD